MKFSIITPEHDPANIPFLLELYESILTQTYEDWEWILYLNNKCTIDHIPDCIKVHPKVKIFRQESDNKNIGFIKNKAFNLGTGDVLVEVDHDDQITPDCLEELAKAYEDETVGFAFTDAAVLHMTDEFVPFNPAYGWTYRTFNWRGKELIAMNSFPPSSQSVGYIWYAPDHVRSWRTSHYKEIGGHNPELSICDDHELMIRTYLTTRMYHIPKVCYIYRITGDNTWLERNEAIQKKTIELFNQHARALAERDAELRGLLKVDIGGGLNPGWAFIEIPSTDGRGAFQDPTHVSYWNENSFLYYTDKYLADFIDNDTIRFQEFRRETYFPNEWMQNMGVLVTTAWLVANKDKDVRVPHLLKI